MAETLIEQLKQGTAPWIRPWQPGERWLPYNPTTSNEYRGMNALWLSAIGFMKEYGDARWMTYKQAQAENAQVKKGEKGTVIQYWKWEGLEPLLDESGKSVRDENGEPKRQMVRYQRPRVISAVVFNASQVDGLPPPPDRPGLPEWERHERAEAILNASGADIRHAPGNKAFYSPTSDRITLPERGQFSSMDGFYATALHELGHWTGHLTRLDRDLAHPFGSEGYAKEELRAEIASLMLGEQLSLGHDPGQHAAYVGSWIRALEEDPREIFRAAADAEKIVRFVRGLEMQQEQAHQHDQNLEAVQASLVQAPVLVGEGFAMSNVPDRVYLEVPYAEKDEAKKLGARWDRQASKWYAKPGVDLEPLQRWMPGQAAQVQERHQDPREEFAAALQEAGLRLEGLPEMNGQLHRVAVEGDARGERSGAYVGFLDGHPAGYINNFKLGLETNWKSGNRTAGLTAADHERLLAEAEQKRQERAEAKEAEQEAAALVAVSLLKGSLPAKPDHPYLVSKGIPPQGLRQTDNGDLLIPMQDIHGKVWSTQTINDYGRKSFQPEGRLLGTYHLIGELAADTPLLIAEGYATAATVHAATGLPVAVAFVSGNLGPVAEAFRERDPERLLIIAGDNDHGKEREGKPNVGREKAEEAAARVGGRALLPQFEPTDTGTDWNDLTKSKGPALVQKQLQDGLAKATRHHQTAQKQNAKTAQAALHEQKPRQQERTVTLER